MKLKMFEIVSTIEHIDMDKIVNYLNKENTCVDKWAYIIHDKDVKDDGSLKSAHLHLCVRLKDAYDSKYVAKWFSVNEQCVERCKGRWSDMLKYLTHENRPEKYQYSEEEVVSNYNWKNDKLISKGDERLKEIVNGIVDGKIREYNYYDYITVEEYVKYKIKIDNAYKYRADRIKGVERVMDCIYITGKSGTGKTTYAKKLCKDKGYSVFVSSGSNDILDGYKGEDCIILDDLRPSCMGLSDLLKMLDNNTSSSVKSRYRNKVIECKLIIITSVLPLENFYRNVFENENEPIEQFKRRCKLYITLEREYMYYSFYDESRHIYIDCGRSENPVAGMYQLKELSLDDARKKVYDMIGNVDFDDSMPF